MNAYAGSDSIVRCVLFIPVLNVPLPTCFIVCYFCQLLLILQLCFDRIVNIDCSSILILSTLEINLALIQHCVLYKFTFYLPTYFTYHIWELRPPITSKRHDVRPQNFARRFVSYVTGTWASSFIFVFSIMSMWKVPFLCVQMWLSFVLLSGLLRSIYTEISYQIAALVLFYLITECCCSIIFIALWYIMFRYGISVVDMSANKWSPCLFVVNWKRFLKTFLSRPTLLKTNAILLPGCLETKTLVRRLRYWLTAQLLHQWPVQISESHITAYMSACDLHSH